MLMKNIDIKLRNLIQIKYRDARYPTVEQVMYLTLEDAQSLNMHLGDELGNFPS